MIDVLHIPSEQRFVCRLESVEATLRYEFISRANNDVMDAVDFTSTFVPPEFRGKGVAEKLVRSGLQWAKEQGYAVQASCWYVAKFIR